MKLTEIVMEQSVVPRVEAATRDEAVRELVQAAVSAAGIDPSLEDELVAKVLEREERGSTGFGRGVAVPHAKHDKLERIVAAVGVAPDGIDFNALDRGPVYSIVLLLSPADQPDQHLQAMENIFSKLQQDQFRRFLAQARNTEDVMDLLGEADAEQLAQ
ncbi:MAG: PTS sugar transporter subunit IIA [Planctomycetota bacterium]